VTPLVFALPDNAAFADDLCAHLDADRGTLEARQFPDGESYLRVDDEVDGRPVVLVCTLDRPNPKVLPLLFLADNLRQLGATEVGLVAPYLAYMRQDKRFREGEAVTSRYFADIVSARLDWLATVDPHLHRYDSLGDIYAVPTENVHAAPMVADWIDRQVDDPVLVGPDEESKQWVDDVADKADLPRIVLEKTRRGDRQVDVSVPEVDRWREHTPVLFDDIISTARTMIETVGHLRRADMPAPVCIGVHGIFADEAYDDLQAADPRAIVTTDTIPHPTNAISVAPSIARATRRLLE
jgi:ribose-phosphate pyrophosphokinase